jgi:hypothetical protein
MLIFSLVSRLVICSVCGKAVPDNGKNLLGFGLVDSTAKMKSLGSVVKGQRPSRQSIVSEIPRLDERTVVLKRDTQIVDVLGQIPPRNPAEKLTALINL